MFTKNKVKIIFIVSLFSLACSNSILFQPTPTAIPTLTSTVTITPIPSHTSTPTISPTPDLLAYYLPYLPQKPDGFEWKIVPSVNLAVLIPDGWYFKEEDRVELGLEGFYVTKENIDTNGRFITGLTVYVFKDFSNYEEAEKYSTDLMALHINLETTKKVIDAWDYPVNNYIFHHLRLEGEFPQEAEGNKNKIIHYVTLAYDTNVFMAVFESKVADWDEMFNNFGTIILDRIAILN